ncbi:MAG: hypothetical protein ABWY23_10215 [Mycetocola sp.]
MQQRMAIERHRSFGVFFLSIGGISALILVIGGVVTSWSWNPWIQIVLVALWSAMGLLFLWRYQREIATFTAEHGTDAGKR